MPPRLTALRRARPGRIALEVDGRPWRIVPDEVVVRCRLASGAELDRELLRRFRRELRSAEAVAAAGRALARRDLSNRRLAHRLERAGVRRPTAEATVARLAEVGVVDDRRLALDRAAALAARWGDAAILARLEQEGIDEAPAREAVAGLAREGERARLLLAHLLRRAPTSPPRDRQDHDRRAVRLLARRGFSPETIEDVLGALDERP